MKKVKRKVGLTRTQWIKLLDRYWSSAIFLRDGGCDQLALHRDNIRRAGKDAHHIMPKGSSSIQTRWRIGNGILLSAGHQYTIAHSHPYKFQEFCVELMGQDNWNRLYQASKMSVQWDYEDFAQKEIDLIDFINKRIPKPIDFLSMNMTAKLKALTQIRRLKL